MPFPVVFESDSQWKSGQVVSPQAWFVHGLLAFRTSQRRRSGCLLSSPRLLPACSHLPDRL
ncbi:hypothetical protein HanRHA438_Chr09g0392401 [Helianthus annuus]|nr:hypothetical protein HanHA89_Chr09g0333421 [Helianthus annuus]KAJ0706941.1 hypothetical protein HanLR1_Chr09g0312871 [Helianthus annuus]KAJ0710960.1 hypothetical protein HanOQP8_Chr09g0318441 [Helianthus annuus]KAJ0887575.1 hypothetical protein HanRHA438_Chr09g0392401 [Helianthus annuus]